MKVTYDYVRWDEPDLYELTSYQTARGQMFSFYQLRVASK